MVDALTPLGLALVAHRRSRGKTMGDQARDTGRQVWEISRIERGRIPIPADYIDEFSTWIGFDEGAVARLRQLRPSAEIDPQIAAKPIRLSEKRDYISALPKQFIRSEAARVRRAGKLGAAEKFSIIRLLEVDIAHLWPDFELHVEPTEEMGDVEAYVAGAPLRMVLSERTYQSGFRNEPRAQFTITHEIGHIVLHEKYLNDPRAKAARMRLPLPVKSRYEQQANRFAIELLLPETIVRRAGTDPGSVSKNCNVSKPAAELRLRELHLWPKKSERIVKGFADLLAELNGRPHRKVSVRTEDWGKIVYDFTNDEFRAEVISGQIPVPKAPIGMGWVIVGGCNQKCVHCYGNDEDLPKERLSIDQTMRVVQAIKDAEIMRVAISGGEPLLYPGIFDIVDRLEANGTSVVLGTNGTFLSTDNVHRLAKCTRVEISLDASEAALNNKIRPSRKNGDAWQESISAIQACLAAGVNVRVLTAINAWNQHDLINLAKVLARLGVRDWALSWTVPAGRAARIFDQLEPNESIIGESLRQIRRTLPSLRLRYSNRRPDQFDRFYFLVLPDGQIATENFKLGRKQTFGSALKVQLASTWTNGNFDREAHFSKWVADRTQPLA